MLLSVTSSYDDMQDVDLVVEAVPENLVLKQRIFHDLDELLPDAILASNTSSLVIGNIAKAVQNPGRVVGMHFFNPPTKMPLIELIPSLTTSNDTIESIQIFSEETLGKKPIVVQDRTGFLINVLLAAYLVPAIRSVEQTNVRPEDIDECARNFGWPMGPFILLDMMGLDLVKEVTTILHNAYGNRFASSWLIDLFVGMGRLGNKSGGGFYGGLESLDAILKKEFPERTEGNAEKTFRLMMNTMIDEATIALGASVASANDIETGCVFGLGFPQSKGGPLHYADEIGIEKVAKELGDDASGTLKDMVKNNETFFSAW